MPLRIALVALAFATSAAAQTPADTLNFSETTPEIVGGLAALQQSIVYPAADRDAGRQGTVVVQFVATATGDAADVRVVRSVSPALDAAAASGVRRARFRPGTQNGQPVNVRMTVPIRFSIRADAPAAAPSRPSLDTGALLNGLGQPWPIAGLLAPDSVIVHDPTHTQALWRSPQPGVEQVEALTTADTLRFVSFHFTHEAEPRLRDLARQIADAHVTAQPDGFVLAYDLAGGGIPAAADLEVRPELSILTYRQPFCRDVPGVGCVAAFPALVGGFREFVETVRRPPSTMDPKVTGEVTVVFVVQPDGSLTDVRVASNTAGNSIGGRVLEAEAVRAVRAARFLPAVRGTTPVATPTSLKIQFR